MGGDIGIDYFDFRLGGLCTPAADCFPGRSFV
jgi:hypothetical protein